MLSRDRVTYEKAYAHRMFARVKVSVVTRRVTRRPGWNQDALFDIVPRLGQQDLFGTSVVCRFDQQSDCALPVFGNSQMIKVQELLTLKVEQMMDRKMREDDWTSIYCDAKGIPQPSWSNIDLDVVDGRIGIEHKMLCYRKPLLTACGTSLMHPSATRALPRPDPQKDPNEEMRRIFKGYEDFLARHRERIVEKIGGTSAEVELRTGLLLWQPSLREFMYFEKSTITPDPNNYYAAWHDSPENGGRRRGSRNLWIYEKNSNAKRYSVTTSAVKLQPYFTVPPLGDLNLYYWKVPSQTSWVPGRTGQVPGLP